MASFGAELEDTKIVDKGELIRTGYMEKQGEIVRSYKKRYFKLWSHRILEYFSNQNNSKSKPKGIIDLSSTLNMTKTDSKEFEIECPSRIWHFKAKTEFSRDSWFESIFNVWKEIDHKYDNKNENNLNQKHKNEKQSYNSDYNDYNYVTNKGPELESAEGSNVYPKINKLNQSNNDTVDLLWSEHNEGDMKDNITGNVPKAPDGFMFHRINGGDTLVSLSVKYGVSQNKIKQYNSDICFGHRLGHISGKLLLIPTIGNVVLTENIKKQIDEIYKQDNKYALSNLDDKEYDEPDENGKYTLRKALMYHTKGLDEYRCDYYLGIAKWNVRKALKLWGKDNIWEKQQRVMKELNMNAENAIILLDNFNWDVDYAIQQRKRYGNKLILKKINKNNKNQKQHLLHTENNENHQKMQEMTLM